MNAINLIATIDTIGQIPRRPKAYRVRADPFLLPHDQFKARYRFNKSSVEKITDLVKPEIELDQRGCGTSARLQVLVALRCWGRRERTISKQKCGPDALEDLVRKLNSREKQMKDIKVIYMSF